MAILYTQPGADSYFTFRHSVYRSVKRLAMSLTTGIRLPIGEETSFSVTVNTIAVGPAQSSKQRRLSSPRIKHTKREGNHSSSSSVEAYNAWSIPSRFHTPLVVFIYGLFNGVNRLEMM
jgi:hypothetical protein